MPPMVTAPVLALEETSEQYVGRWNHLVSTTNWEKGRIIQEWRAALIEAGAPAADSSDETWARRVGGVSPQHVGRLRRVFERFDENRASYEGLYWSHFHSALDWEDAEMWLEGAVQNRWSVKQMMHQRWETLGGPESQQPRDEDVVSSEQDEDLETVGTPSELAAEVGEVRDTSDDADSDDYEEDENDDDEETSDARTAQEELTAAASAAAVRPFQALPSLPDDLAEAMESFKLSIVRHKLLGWDEISPDGMLACLDALRTLVLAPAE